MKKRKYNFSTEQLERMEGLYEKGTNTIEIAKEFKVSIQTINRRLKELGVKMRKKGKLLYFSEQTLQSMWNDYSSGKTVYDIAGEFGVKPVTIYRKFKANGFIVYSTGNRSKSTFNQNFFDKIDTEEKAYWLGFIYADGCITSNKDSYLLKIGLSSADAEHLELFKCSIDSNHPTYYSSSHLGNKKFLNCQIQIYSKYLCRQLIEKGALPRKSLTLKFPSSEVVPKELLHHFIRGFFDGDGCISFPRRGRYNTLSDMIPVVIFTSTKEMLEELKKHIPSTGIIKVRKPSGKRNIYEIRLSGIRQTKTVLEYMYKDATVYLKRKHENYQKLLSIVDSIDEKLTFRQLTTKQATTIQVVFNKYMELQSIPAVLRFLRENEYTTLRGRQFCYTTLSHMLSQESYTKPMKIDNHILTLISAEDFQKVQEKLSANRNI
ncbi:recombinase family protein [Bacillus toyonensis]|uniref:recombinase family protein n=1 Tax=Bacillus toyonensis TaxID=155322 RepID=UPI003000878F